MAHRRSLWLIAVVGLLVGACGGDDSTPTGSGGSSASGGSGGSAGSGGSGTGGTAGDTGSGGSGGTSGASGSGGSAGNPDAGSKGDAPTSGDAGPCLPAGTMNVVNDGSAGYLFDNGPLNPVLTLCRGNRYTFVIDAPGHPIYIRSQSGSYNNGVTGNRISSGNLVFDVPRDAPDLLFYQCDIHDVMTGAIVIVD